jgi:transposase
MDMSKSYYSAVRKYLPGVDIVFDRFHVMQLVNKSIDKVRRKQQKSLEKQNRKTLKGCRFLILTSYEKLDLDQQKRLANALEANHPLYIMHIMKEQLRLLWSKQTRHQALHYLSVWIIDAINVAFIYEQETGLNVLSPLAKLARSLMHHMDGILDYFKYFITNGKIEGINNKIKTLKRQAYGYRDKEYFRLRLLHLHAQKTQLAG